MEKTSVIKLFTLHTAKKLDKGKHYLNLSRKVFLLIDKVILHQQCDYYLAVLTPDTVYRQHFPKHRRTLPYPPATFLLFPVNKAQNCRRKTQKVKRDFDAAL